MGVCKWSSFLLFNMRYVRYLMAVRRVTFMRFFMLFCENVEFHEFVCCVFMNGTSYSLCDCYEGSYFPSIVF